MTNKIYLLGKRGSKSRFKLTTAEVYSSLQFVAEKAYRDYIPYRYDGPFKSYFSTYAIIYALELNTGVYPKRVSKQEMNTVAIEFLKKLKEKETFDLLQRSFR